MSSLILVYTVCRDLSVRKFRPDLRAVWFGSTLFTRICLSEDLGLIYEQSDLVYTVCPDLSVWKLRPDLWAVLFGSTLFARICLSEKLGLNYEQSDLGLHCFPGSVCPKTYVWFMSRLIWVYTVCPDLSVRKLTSDLWAVLFGSTLFARICLAENLGLIYEQSDLGLHCLPGSVCPKI